ncbi:MAG TPA: sigma-54 dependent transcriptional regulator [Desulfopila sp.]|nr:sigma-54 dependent transcriptional regulator [Desulfopila sp.]
MSAASADARKDEDRCVIIVDDEPDMLSMLSLVISKKCGCSVLTALSGSEALVLIDEQRPEVVITDIKMPDIDGLELQRRIRRLDPTISIVIMTGYGTIDMAVEALKNGAYDFLQKPFEKDQIVRIVHNCLERTVLLRTNRALKAQLSTIEQTQGFVGQSPALRRVLDLLARIADTDATVLIRGESGTGKEVAARTLHNLSDRRKQRMITVNCPALPENVLESELFGYSKGAFTGAQQDRKGLFLEADGSTILLDEIADISIAVQTKLLRVLQEKEIQPLGQNKTFKVSVRVVASTNQDLEAKIAAGEFREDLFYRLNVVSVTMPSLREMKEDIPLLIHHFLQKYQKQYDREAITLPAETLQKLYRREWQGNIRELQNTIKRIVLLSRMGEIPAVDVEDETPVEHTSRQPVDTGFADLFDCDYNEAKAAVLQRFTKRYVQRLLNMHRGNVTAAAAVCGLERQALQRIMRRYRILSSDYKPSSD